MGDKLKSLHKGKMRVSSPAGYKVYEKKIPKNLKKSRDYEKYEWIGNFGFKKKSNNKKIKGNFDESYEIQVDDRYEKDLVYWNGKKTIKFSKTKVKYVGKGKFRSAKLKMGDPPVGWVL